MVTNTVMHNNTNKPTNDLAQIEKIQKIVHREILGKGRRLFPEGRWPSDGVKNAENQLEPYTAAMKFGGRDPTNKKKPGMTKRPPNMWMVFRMHAASVVMEDFPEVNQAALTSVLAPIWQNTLTVEEKDRVRRESEKLKEFHKIQFPEWKYRPKQKKRNNTSDLSSSPSQLQKVCSPLPYSTSYGSYGSLLSEDQVDGKLLSVDTNLHYDYKTSISSSMGPSNMTPHSSTWSTGTSPFMPISPAAAVNTSNNRPSSALQLIHVPSPQHRMRPASQPDFTEDKDQVLRSILSGPSTTISYPTASHNYEYSSTLPDFLQEPYFSDFVLPSSLELDAYLSAPVTGAPTSVNTTFGMDPTKSSFHPSIKQEYDFVMI